MKQKKKKKNHNQNSVMGKDDHGQEVTRSENKSLSILYYIIL